MSAEPFSSPEAAWFWTMQALTARADGAGLQWSSGICEPDDVVNAVNQLYVTRRLSLQTVVMLRNYGSLARSPDPLRKDERADSDTWRRAMVLIGDALREKGIVRPLPRKPNHQPRARHRNRRGRMA